MRAENNFNLIRLLAAGQVLVVHSFNHLEYEGILVNLFKLIPGVPVFFFVSGMLISASYERLAVRQMGLREFIVNRLLRIYPALWMCVLLSVLCVWLTGYLETKEFSTSQFLFWIIGQISFFQFYNPDFMRGFGVGVLNGALWTIAVELQFYALTPLLVWLLRNRLSWFLIVLIASVSINVWLRLAYDWSDIRIKILSVSFLPWVYMFMMGVLAQAYRAHLEALFHGMSSIVWTVLLTAYIASMVFIGSFSQNSNNAIHPIAFLFLCALIFNFSNLRIPKFGGINEFIRRNDYSYGIYIFHTPVLNFILYLGFLNSKPNWELLLVTLVPIFLAALSWHFIEERVLALKGRL